MRSRSRTSLLVGLPALAVALIALVVAGGFVVKARAQEPSRLSSGLPNSRITRTMIDPAAAVAPSAPMPKLVAPVVLPVTSGERSNSLVLRAVVGLLLLVVAGVVGRLLLKRRSAVN